jgi:hypothetical protein
MSAMLKTRPRSALTRRANTSDAMTETAKSRPTTGFKQVRPEEEPPENSVRETEAPESWQECHAEAPDAGRGESHFVEGDFSHGRSRS